MDHFFQPKNDTNPYFHVMMFTSIKTKKGIFVIFLNINLISICNRWIPFFKGMTTELLSVIPTKVGIHSLVIKLRNWLINLIINNVPFRHPQSQHFVPRQGSIDNNNSSCHPLEKGDPLINIINSLQPLFNST